VNWLKQLFGEEEKPVAATGSEVPVPEIVNAVGTPSTPKIKLNFKGLPKETVQSIADETTGQTIDRNEKQAIPKNRTGLSDIFNAASRGDDDRARRLAALMTREERAQAALAPARRMPSPSPG
jgi:hypothetical protein